MTASVRTIAIVSLVLLLAGAGTWLTLELAADRTPQVEIIRPAPTASTPGPPVADWRAPQHRWETTPR